MNYNEKIEKYLEEKNENEFNKSLLITGHWGVGKSYLIKEFFDNINKKNLDYKYYKIINANKIDKNFNIEKEFIKNCINVEDNKEINILSIDETSENSLVKGLESLVSTFGGKNLVSSSSKIIDEYLIEPKIENEINKLDNYIVVIDEIDRKPDFINIKDIFTKIIELQERNKNKNIKIIVILNSDSLNKDDKKILKEWKEKIFSYHIEVKNKKLIEEEISYIKFSSGIESFINFDKLSLRVLKKFNLIKKYIEDKTQEFRDSNSYEFLLNILYEDLFIRHYKLEQEKDYIEHYLKKRKIKEDKKIEEEERIKNEIIEDSLIIKEFFSFDRDLLDKKIEKIIIDIKKIDNDGFGNLTRNINNYFKAFHNLYDKKYLNNKSPRNYILDNILKKYINILNIYNVDFHNQENTILFFAKILLKNYNDKYNDYPFILNIIKRKIKLIENDIFQKNNTIEEILKIIKEIESIKEAIINFIYNKKVYVLNKKELGILNNLNNIVNKLEIQVINSNEIIYNNDYLDIFMKYNKINKLSKIILTDKKEKTDILRNIKAINEDIIKELFKIKPYSDMSDCYKNEII